MDGISTKELAKEAGVITQRVYQWAGEGLKEAAQIGRNRWDRDRALAWIGVRRAANLHEPWQNQQVTDASTGDITSARHRLYVAQGDGVELRNAILRGELITRALLESTMAELGVAMLAPLDEWVRAGGSAAQVARNQEAANALRTEWVRAVESVQRTIDAGEDLGPTRVRLPGRMGG